jgi:hypothetical protein
VCVRSETDKKSLKFKTEQTVFSDINFNKVAADPYFKEDKVLEAIVSPMLGKLGYT